MSGRRRGFFRPKLRRLGAPDAAAAGGVSLRSFRAVDQGGAFVAASTRVHFPGLNHAASATDGWIGGTQSNTLQGVGAGQMAYAIPEPFDGAGTIDRLVMRLNGAISVAGAPRYKLGVYSDGTRSSGVFSGSPYPDARLAQSTDLVASAGNILLESLVSVDVEPGDRIWFVWACNADAVTDSQTVVAYQAGVLYPILGFTFNASLPTTIAQDNATGGVGWRHAITYGTTDDLPATFPQTAPAVLTNLSGVAQIPAPGFGFVAAT